MILWDHWEVEIKSGSNDKEMPPLKNVSDDDVKYSVEGESLVMVHNECSGQRAWFEEIIRECLSYELSYQ
jgi:hypothetical protein